MTSEVHAEQACQDLEVERKLDFVVQFMALIGDKLYFLPDEHKRELLDKLEALFFESFPQDAIPIENEAILAVYHQQRRQAFAAQVRQAIGPSLKELSQRQKDLLDASLTKLFDENRPVSNEEIEGRLELVTEFVSPQGQEKLQEAYWNLRLNPESHRED